MRQLLSSATVSAASIFCLATLLPAQIAAIDVFIGQTNDPAQAGKPAGIALQNANCQGKVVKNLTQSLLHNAAPHAGGTAYDPGHETVWVSDGVSIDEYHVNGPSGVRCTFKPTLQSTGAVISGLAISPSRRELYVLESFPRYMGISTYDISVCPPLLKRSPSCSMKNFGAVGETAGGLAYDELRDLFYVGTTWAPLVGKDSGVYVAMRIAPCGLIKLPVKVCNPGIQLSGLAYGNCSKNLYVANSREVSTSRMDDPLMGLVKNITAPNSCCAKGTTPGWGGLCLVPGWQGRSIGKSCLDVTCGSCGSMRLSTFGNDPFVGNTDFGFEVTGAPNNSIGYMYISLGSCLPASGGINIPGLCGAVYTPVSGIMPLLIHVAFMPGVSPPCAGKARFKTGVPPDAALCGVKVCAQWLIRCQSGTAGAGLTNAIDFPFVG